MAHGRSPRKNKNSNLLVEKPGGEEQQYQWYPGDRENIVSKMSPDEKTDAVKYIHDRFDTAKEQTLAMREKMQRQDMQYKGEWQSANANQDEDVFIPKTREEVNAIKNYFISILSQLHPIVKMEPYGTTTILSNFQDDYRRAKLNEALFNFYWSEIWHASDDVMPRFLLHYLKYPMALLKICYYETDYDADLKLELKDRAFMYLDPRVNLFNESGWVMEEYYLPKSEVTARIDRGDWELSQDEFERINSVDYTQLGTEDMKRFFGDNNTIASPIMEDELVQCFDYYQFPRKGLPDVYAVILGGVDGEPNGMLARFGRNPNPYKGNPYVGITFNPDDRPDGESLCDMQAPFQMIINTLYNLRVQDIKKNIIRRKYLPEEMVDDQTIEDWEAGATNVRYSKSFMELIMSDDKKKVSDFIFEEQGFTSTSELITHDLDWIMNQGQKSANLPDVFRGLNAQPGATLGQVQEQIARSTGQFTAPMRQVMRAIERIAEISTSYFRSSDFYPAERIVRIVGKQNYEDIITQWDVIHNNTAYKSVTADEMDVDLIFNAVSGADAIAAKTLLMTSIERLFLTINANPELFNQLNDRVDFTALFLQLINVSGYDLDNFLLSDKARQEREAKEKQKKEELMQEQRQLQMEQLQLQGMAEEIKAQLQILVDASKNKSMAQKQVTVDTSRIMQQAIVDDDMAETESDLRIKELVEKYMAETMMKMKLQDQEIKDEHELMEHEASLERAAIQQGQEVSVGRKEKDVQLNKPSQ